MRNGDYLALAACTCQRARDSDEAGEQEAKQARQTLSGGAEALQSKRAHKPKGPEENGMFWQEIYVKALCEAKALLLGTMH